MEKEFRLNRNGDNIRNTIPNKRNIMNYLRSGFYPSAQKVLFSFLILILCLSSASGQPSQPDAILMKKQKEFLSWKFGMFIHFNMATFNEQEWANGWEDTLLFNPSRLDCGQWADAAKAAGMGYAVLTVKHTGGWCLWDSKYTRHDIARFSNFRNGKGDLVKEYIDAFRSRGLKIGLYYCLPGDYSNQLGNKLKCGQADLHALFPEATGDFEWYIERQVEELLTRYGKIDMIWFDQYTNPYTGKYWQQLKAVVNKIQPECVVVANNCSSYDETDIIGYEFPYLKLVRPGRELPPVGNKNASEVCDCLDERGWFWHKGGETVKKVDDIVNMVTLSNSRSANYLLDVPPNGDGVIPDLYVSQLKAIGAKLHLH
jgi:alpha-L-fucosidase